LMIDKNHLLLLCVMWYNYSNSNPWANTIGSRRRTHNLI
jgi:hypothetical protein